MRVIAVLYSTRIRRISRKTYCMDTGLLASGACREAGRAATGRFWKDKVPTETCSHENIEKKYDFETSGVDNITTMMTTRKAIRTADLRTPTAATRIR